MTCGEGTSHLLVSFAEPLGVCGMEGRWEHGDKAETAQIPNTPALLSLPSGWAGEAVLRGQSLVEEHPGFIGICCVTLG